MSEPLPPSPPADAWRRADTWVLVALLLCFGVLYWQLQFREHTHTFDGTVYLSGAKSLATGLGYRFHVYADQPKIGMYPPLTSAVLSLAFRINPSFPENLPLLNSIMIASALCVLAAAYLVLRRLGVPLGISALAVSAFGTSPMWAMWVFLIGPSDVFFAAILLGFLAWWIGRTKPATIATWLITGTVMGLAYLTRTAAVALIAGLGLIAAVQSFRGRRWVVATFALPVAAAGVGWKWMSRGTPEYLGVLSTWLERLGGWQGYVAALGQNLVYTIRGNPAAEIFCPFYIRIPALAYRFGEGFGVVANVICALLFLSLLALAARGFWRSRSPLHWSLLLLVALYVAEVVVMPFSPWFFSRYFIPLWPVCFVWLWRGLPTGTPRRRHLTAGAVLSLMIASNLWLLARTWRGEKEEPQDLVEFTEVTNWVQAHSGANDQIAADWSVPILQLHAALARPLLADYLANPRRLEAPVRHEDQGRRPASLLICTRRSARTNAPPGLLTPVFVSSHQKFDVYRVDPDRERQYQLELYGTPPPR